MTNFVSPYPIGGISDESKVRVVLWINDRFIHVPLSAITNITDRKIEELQNIIEELDERIRILEERINNDNNLNVRGQYHGNSVSYS